MKNYEACIDDEGVARFQLEITPKELLEADTETTLQINAMLAPRDLVSQSYSQHPPVDVRGVTLPSAGTIGGSIGPNSGPFEGKSIREQLE